MSSLIQKAKLLLAHTKSVNVAERTEAAIELAGLMLEEAHRTQTSSEKKQQKQLAALMNDPAGKAFTTAMTDQCFRSQNASRVANQLRYLIRQYGIPRYLSPLKRFGLWLFKYLGEIFANVSVPMVMKLLQKETAKVIVPEEKMREHILQRRQEGVRLNLNHLGEAILGQEEAKHRLQIYLDDLANPEIEYISVKISTIYSQINLLAWDRTLEQLASALRQLYRAAKAHVYIRPDGSQAPKFVNLDMEEYRDLHLTVELFQKVLDEPEFHDYSAGIVLQSYLPDSFAIQQELTAWAKKRVSNQGAPIKIRIVKGANLAMEQIEAALKIWPQAPYLSKAEVDANYKRMVNEGLLPDNAKAVHIGIASHNLFDIAYALILRAEKGLEKQVSFEMLEGMAEPMRRVVQQLSGDMLLYCPVVAKKDFQNGVAYLVRRLDENTAPENFLRHAFDLSVGTEEWLRQANDFRVASLNCDTIASQPRRTQNRWIAPTHIETLDFQNEPDTDWALPQNRQWGEQILKTWSKKKIEPIPLMIGGKAIYSHMRMDAKNLYQYSLATQDQINQIIHVAKEAETQWGRSTIKQRADLLKKIAQGFRRHRADLIGAMIADTAKTASEADVEVSEAVDFAEYYARNIEELASLPDIEWQPKGTVLITPPWNFPCSIPAGGVLAALAAGNCVILKPASEAVLVGWHVAQIIWEAGVDPHVFQFITCEDEPEGSQLIRDPRINAVVLTGATETAKRFLSLRPDLDLIAETGGKNTLVITAMADRDLAIKDLIHSAFGHAGQKCSACSLAILEAEVYDSPDFRKQLRDAVASLAVGPAWDLKTKVNPLIRPPNENLLRGLTTLEPGEEWLLEPKQDVDHPNLWSPGIKLGVTPNSFTFQTELFGPVLGLVRANDFSHALELMNQTPYGLTGGIHTLDEREQERWIKKIEVGNCYINRTTTGAIVQRQPFGGCKESSFGRGAKAGGPNYVAQLMVAKQKEIVGDLETTSIENYHHEWKHYFSQKHDPSRVRGQDNFQYYVPHPKVVLRVQEGDTSLDVRRVVAAAEICGTPLEVNQEDEKLFIQRIEKGDIKRVRLLKSPSAQLQNALAKAGCRLNVGPVLANGRLELLHYLREVSLSHDYHRYGNLGMRENGNDNG